MTSGTNDSGIEWIGVVPSDYGVWSISNFFHQLKNKNEDLLEENLLSLSYGKIIKRDINSPDGLLPSSFSGYNIVDKDDIVLRMTDLQNDKKSLRTGLVNEKGIITSAYITLRKRRRLPFNICSKYIYYHLHAFDIVKGFYGMGNGVRQNVTFNDIKKMKIMIPKYQKQKRIVTVLEHKLERIEIIIKETQQSIEQLKSFKQSIITETVTKGLDPNVQMKDSRIEWIGKIPKHWKVKYINNFFDQVKDKNINLEEENLLSLSYGSIIRRNIKSSEGLLPANFKTYNIVQNGDIVLRMTDLQNDKTSLRTGFVNEQGIITSAYITIRTSHLDIINQKYIQLLLHSFDIYKGFYGMGSGVRQNVTFNDIKKLQITLPKINEQQQIVAYLDKRTKNVDILINDKEKIIEELEQYEKSIIYEYVTGKIEV